MKTKPERFMQTDMLNLHQQAWKWKGLRKAAVMNMLDEWLQTQLTAELDLEVSPAAIRLETLAYIPQCFNHKTHICATHRQKAKGN